MSCRGGKDMARPGWSRIGEPFTPSPYADVAACQGTFNRSTSIRTTFSR